MAVFVILQFSYNPAPDQRVAGGICQSAFFIDSKTALTAHHNFNTGLFRPVGDYKRVRFWLASRDGILIPIDKDYLVDHPEIDTTIIRFPSDQRVEAIGLSAHIAQEGDEVRSLGFDAAKMPRLDLRLLDGKLEVSYVDLSDTIHDGEGIVRRILTRNVTSDTINLRNIRQLKLSFGGTVGMSGGPLVIRSSGEAVGLMSYGLPQNEHIKHTLFAISADEITRRMGGLQDR